MAQNIQNIDAAFIEACKMLNKFANENEASLVGTLVLNHKPSNITLVKMIDSGGRLQQQ